MNRNTCVILCLCCSNSHFKYRIFVSSSIHILYILSSTLLRRKLKKIYIFVQNRVALPNDTDLLTSTQYLF